MKQKIIYGVTVVLSVVLLLAGNFFARQGGVTFDTYDDTVCKATVLHFSDGGEMADRLASADNTNVFFEAKITSGPQKGQTVTAAQSFSIYDATPARLVQEGDKVLLMFSGNDWYFWEYIRSDALLWLAGVFALALVVYGRMKGVNTLISLGFTVVSVFVVFIPAVMSGQNIYLWAILVCIYIIVMTLILVNGWNRKSLAAGIGCASGVLMAGLLTLIMDLIMHLSGITGESSVYLQNLTDVDLDLKAIIFAGIILGAVGAIMDVSVSIAASLAEVKDKAAAPTRMLLFRSGLNIGRDVMGTMANTLVLAYIGSSLSTTLLLYASAGSMLNLFNREMVVVEVLQALVGSIGILLTLPLTAFISAMLYAPRQK